MRLRACASAIGVLLLLGSCAERWVDLPVTRPPAVPAQVADGPVRCPADTVAYADTEPSSGAGAVPAGFEGRTVLACHVDYTTARTRDGVTRFTVRQRQEPLTPELRAALDLPDRELRPTVACAAGLGGDTVVYLVDARRQTIRVWLPRQSPCQEIRREVAALLPTDESAAEVTFAASRPAR